jgi:5-methylcytosine-specific restriction endonuclease McrA
VNRNVPLKRGEARLARSAELKRAAPFRRTRMPSDAPVKPQRNRGDDPPPWVRKAVADRSGGLCEKCRKARAVHVHHRQPKQRGGTRRAHVHALFNLLNLCTRCHELVHRAPAESYDRGWLVHSGTGPECDPRLVPVTTETSEGVVPLWLTADGGVTETDPRGAA